MKLAKIMLTAIAVLAVVGGALAFKANKRFISNYCILTTVQKPNGGVCTGDYLNAKTTVLPTSSYWYTTKNIGDACNQKLCTVNSMSITGE